MKWLHDFFLCFNDDNKPIGLIRKPIFMIYYETVRAKFGKAYVALAKETCIRINAVWRNVTYGVEK